MAYQMVATAVTLNDLEGHIPLADVFKCNPSNSCAALYTISTDSVLAWFLCISRACCQQLSHITAIIFQLTQRVARFLCSSRASCYGCPVRSTGKPLCFTYVLYSSSSPSFQTLFSEVTDIERIPFVLSHNIRSRCNLIMHPQKFVEFYPPQKNHPKPQKWAFRRPSTTLDGEYLCNETSHRQSPP